MKRIHFDRESGIIGEDFAALIQNYGGKAAGLMLARKMFYDAQGFPKSPEPVYIPEFAAIATSLYRRAEEVLREKLPSPLESYKKTNPRKSWVTTDGEALLESDLSVLLFSDRQFQEEMRNNVRKCTRKFEKYPDFRTAQYHVRSSVTLEDFFDDCYYGTFESLPGRFSFKKQPPGKKVLLVHDLIELMKLFYAQKHHADGSYELTQEDSLGMVVMPSIGGLHVISYSSYPEIPHSPTVHEISRVRGFSDGESPTPLALIKVHGNLVKDIEVIPATRDAFVKQQSDESLDNIFVGSVKSNFERDNPFEINGVRSPLSPDEIGRLTAISQSLERSLGYSVNTEWKLVREGNFSDVYLLQLRPVPMIEPFSPLPPPDPSQQTLAETPFVYGIFKYHAPVVLTEDKNIARIGISMPKPVIVWDSAQHKGHRLYWGNQGENCLALINPEEGRTLSHDRSIVPPFGKRREKFHALGVPQLSRLYDCLQPTEYLLLHGDRMGRFQETPFSVLIESDGRQGRVSIALEDFEFYPKK